LSAETCPSSSDHQSQIGFHQFITHVILTAKMAATTSTQLTSIRERLMLTQTVSMSFLSHFLSIMGTSKHLTPISEEESHLSNI
jgi:hypothetical protein